MPISSIVLVGAWTYVGKNPLRKLLDWCGKNEIYIRRLGSKAFLRSTSCKWHVTSFMTSMGPPHAPAVRNVDWADHYDSATSQTLDVFIMRVSNCWFWEREPCQAAKAWQ